MNESICIIPARSGSKRLPGKNVRDFAGHPLISWTITAALNSNCFSRVIVSTDCSNIAEIAGNYGGEVPFLRDIEISGDSASTESVVLDTADKLGICENAVVSLLQPTSPLRDSKDIRKALEIFASVDADSLISVTSFKLDRKWLLTQTEDGYVKFPESEPGNQGGIADRFRSFFPNGALYMTSVKSLRNYGVLAGGRVWPFIMASWKSIDIDTLEDFELAQFSLKHFAQNRLGSMDTP